MAPSVLCILLCILLLQHLLINRHGPDTLLNVGKPAAKNVWLSCCIEEQERKVMLTSQPRPSHVQ